MSTSKNKNLTWNSSTSDLFSKNIPKTYKPIIEAGLTTLEDLLWVLPNRIQKSPEVESFIKIKLGTMFRGHAKILNITHQRNFRARGRGNTPLMNINVVAQDLYSSNIVTLKWFNTYTSVYKKLASFNKVQFLGEVSEFMGKKQIINPQIEELTSDYVEKKNEDEGFLITYPTINKSASHTFKKLLDKIPAKLWDNIEETLPQNVLKKRKLLNLSECFKIIHGKIPTSDWNKKKFQESKNRLIYEELFLEQLKIKARRASLEEFKAPQIILTEKSFLEITNSFPYSLTRDQLETIKDIRDDFKVGKPMMRLIQGDVGCGKTSVGISAALMAIEKGYQVAFMCPTEALAIQHFETLSQHHILSKLDLGILLGSTKAAQKREVLKNLSEGKIHFIVGTHSLIQDSVEFKNLGLTIIDEQHKFGVAQRQKLTAKSEINHTLIMTATPIPRSLSLTQYGDLDISSIRHLPTGRKGIKTRIVEKHNFQKFLTFLKTRISMGEQAYVVVPAIEESEKLDIVALENVIKDFKKYFPLTRIEALHGKMKPLEKENIFKGYSQNKIDILISTSVVEVGINVKNATIMAIMNPDRFGLSSLHQLRGRVGRGDKPGFCFLILDEKKGMETMERLRVIESTTDGFKIAEEDLRIRGEGNLFGTKQSGSKNLRKVANIIINQEQLVHAKEDILKLIEQNDPFIATQLNKYKNDSLITHTI